MQQNHEEVISTSKAPTVPVYEGTDDQDVDTAVQDEPTTPSGK
jgi:hypothetical protein